MELENVPVRTFTRLLHPYPTFLVTCAGPEGETNAITIAWLMPVSVQPPLLTLAVRRERYSYDLIAQGGEFVVNVMPYERAREALFCGRRSGRDVDKFEALGLEAAPGREVDVPVLVEDGAAFLECRLRQEVEAGDHVLFIAEVVTAYARSGFLSQGRRDLSVVNPLLHLGGSAFTTTTDTIVEPEL